MNRNLIGISLIGLAWLKMAWVHAVISPIHSFANLNSFAPSIMSATFHQRGEAPSPMNFQIIVPIHPLNIKNLKCIYEIMTESTIDPYQRTFPIEMQATPSNANPSYSSIIGGVNITQDYDLGFFELICSFFLDGDHNVVKGQTISYAWNTIDTGTVLGSLNIAPFKSFADSVAISLAPPKSDLSSTFTINNPNSLASGITMTVSNSAKVHGTSAATTIFSPAGKDTYCDVYRDGINFPDSVVGSVSSFGAGITFRFVSPINSSKNLVIRCPSIKGSSSVAEQLRPSLLAIVSDRNRAFSLPEKMIEG